MNKTRYNKIRLAFVVSLRKKYVLGIRENTVDVAAQRLSIYTQYIHIHVLITQQLTFNDTHTHIHKDLNIHTKNIGVKCIGWQRSHLFFSFFFPSTFSSFLYTFFLSPPNLHRTIQFLPRPTPVDKNRWVMTVEADMTKWSELDYIAFKINNFLVISILKILSETEREVLCHRLWWYTPSKSELLCVPDSPYLMPFSWKKLLLFTLYLTCSRKKLEIWLLKVFFIVHWAQLLLFVCFF